MTLSAAAAAFAPRTVFPVLDSLPRSYYLGHHAAGLAKIRTMLSHIDLVVECRDYRIPLTSRNPMFEDSLLGKERLVVYTKKDLGGNANGSKSKAHDALLRKLHHPSPVLCSDHKSSKDVRSILSHIRDAHSRFGSLTGSHLLIVGMPNVGKSSLLNALRREGVGKGKVAHTGAQPGVTRKIGTSVKIISDDDGSPTGGGGGIYLLDTPGVFIPFVPDSTAMLKLALCGSVKDTIIPPTTIADFLLFHINLHDPHIYSQYHVPTNDIWQLLEAIAVKSGRLQKGGTPDTESAALWMIQRWRNGFLGRFLLDEVNEETSQQWQAGSSEQGPMSMNQARKASKEALRERSRARASTPGR